jgi:hypothetical protein
VKVTSFFLILKLYLLHDRERGKFTAKIGLGQGDIYTYIHKCSISIPRVRRHIFIPFNPVLILGFK